MKIRELMVMVTTVPDAVTAGKIAHDLVDAGLAVCAQVDPEMTSVYRWEDKIASQTEVRLTLKVLTERFSLCRGELELQHPYDVPQIIAWPASYVAEAYLAWARGEGK